MQRARFLPAPRRRSFLHFLAAIVLTFLLSRNGSAQAASPGTPALSPDELNKFTQTIGAVGKLMQKIQGKIQYPPPRSLSHLLPMLPEGTVVYVALPNYGELSHQALDVFQQELKENVELRNWWQRGDMATEGPKIEDGIEKFYQLSQYLGDEIVASASSEGKGDPSFLLIAEVKKPGLKEYLRQFVKDMAGKSKPAARIVDDAELEIAKGLSPSDPVILVRPDLVVLAENLSTLRRFTAASKGSGGFATTEFGQRMTRGYDGGATILAGADLQAIFKTDPPDKAKEATLRQTGFSDMKYVVWEHHLLAGQPTNQIELSFLGPRRSLAGWLAAPGPMGSLDFVSSHAAMVASLLLQNGAQIFDDIKSLASASNPNAFASMTQMEQSLNISFRDDVYAKLSGEITLEIDNLAPTQPIWKVIFKTTDPSGPMPTLNKVFAAINVRPLEFEEDGVVYHSVPVPSAQSVQEIGYAMVDNYLIIGSSRAVVTEAVRNHRNGESLARSDKLQASLPPGHSGEMSGLLYQDSATWARMMLRQLSPQIAETVVQSKGSASSVMTLYGEENALREVSLNSGMDIGTVMIVSAIAIPNLIRASAAANESSAVSNIRTANVAQISYSITYPKKGFATDLASLGPNPDGSNVPSPQHAGLINSSLGDPTCTAGAWCTKAGYRFTMTTLCPRQPCKEYVVLGVPDGANSGTRNFCSTSDAVVRSKAGPPLTSPITAAECLKWSPLSVALVNESPPR